VGSQRGGGGPPPPSSKDIMAHHEPDLSVLESGASSVQVNVFRQCGFFLFKFSPSFTPPPRPTDAVLSDRKERCGEGRERESCKPPERVEWVGE